MSSYSSYTSTSHQTQPQRNPNTAMIPHPAHNPRRSSSYSHQQLQPVAQENYFYPEHPGYPRQSSHHSHHSHDSHHHHHDSNTMTDSDEERRYREDQELERRPTLGGSLLSFIGKLGKFLGAERR